MWLWLTWKNLGWAIMYIAAISSIITELFEAVGWMASVALG